MLLVPACVPVEIAPRVGESPRVFRLSAEVGVARLSLAEGLPEEPGWLHDPVRLRFHLPGDALAIECLARAEEVVLDRDTERERAVRGALAFIELPPESAARIEKYVEERLQRA